MQITLKNDAIAAEPRPDLRHVEAWIFDLDNTLYPAHADLFAQIDARMSLFIRNHFGVDEAEAWRIQKAYYRDHGTTLNGLMRVNNVDPESFLSFVHDIDLSVLTPDARLGAAISRLPGKRIVFTNGCSGHAARVLERLELTAHFHDVWDIRKIGYRPKPDPQSYRAVLGAVPAARAAMFEDVARNLVPAHELGMTTVWLKNGSEWSKQGPEFPRAEPRHIHYEIENLADFLHSIRI
ncbi:MAG TPA: pyrimidine 5'-nucleotidase [Rhizomicrobium sp.]|nr:pyrimidine 5'-nucleotidase [Rhizomicrobium sp.]